MPPATGISWSTTYTGSQTNEPEEASLREVIDASPSTSALVNPAATDVDAALDALERAFDAHEPLMPWVANPGFMPFDDLRNTERFKKLLERSGFPEPDLVTERSRVEPWLAVGN